MVIFVGLHADIQRMSTATTARGRRRLSKMTMDGERICALRSFKALGHTVSGVRRKVMKVTKLRVKKAELTARRVKRLKMPTRKQKAAGAMGLVMPRAAYGAWLTRMAKKDKGPLATTMMELAWGIKGGKFRAKEMLKSLVLPTHRVDPDDVMDYQTITTMARLMRRNEELRRRVGKMVAHMKGGNAKKYDGPFPVKRLMEVMSRMEGEVDEELNVVHDALPTFNLVDEHPGWVSHAVRYMIRSSLWEKLAIRAAKGERSDFNGLQLIDIAATTKTIRKETEGGVKRRTLEMLVTGAIPTWQRCAKYKHPPVQECEPPSSEVCPFCRQGVPEDMEHILWGCQRWEEEREEMRKEMRKEEVKEEELPRITKNQGVIFEDHELIRWRKESVKKEWGYEENPLPEWKEGGVEAKRTEEGRRVVYTDGSCLDQSDERVRTAGCGIFITAGHSWNLGFPLPGVVQSSEVAEARAALHVLEGATAQGFDVEVRLDNRSVVDTLAMIARGEEVEYEKGRSIWRRAEEAMRRRKEEGGRGHAVTWVPGHTDTIDVIAGRISEEDRRGNVNVDEMAKRGAAVDVCPEEVAKAAVRRIKIGTVLHNGFAEILMRRREVMKTMAKSWEEEEDEPEDPWAPLQPGPRVNKLGLATKRKVKREEESETRTEEKKEEEAMRIMWPGFQWCQRSEPFTVKRAGGYAEGAEEEEPLHKDMMKAVRWYWDQLRWKREEEEADAEERGVTWKELAVDCWASTGVILKSRRDSRKTTTLRQMTDCFAKVSRWLEERERRKGGWLWVAKQGRSSSLAPLGQRAALCGLTRRPRLLAAAEVGVVLCRAAGRSGEEMGAEEDDEVVEKWKRRCLPLWRRAAEARAVLLSRRGRVSEFDADVDGDDVDVWVGGF